MSALFSTTYGHLELEPRLGISPCTAMLAPNPEASILQARAGSETTPSPLTSNSGPVRCRQQRPPSANKTIHRRTRQVAPKPIRVVTINTRSLLCDRSPGLAETARTKVFRTELVRRDLHIVCVQETKLAEDYGRDCEHFQVVAVSPKDRVGGLQVLIAKNNNLKVLWSCSYSFRVLAVGVQWGQEKWCVINAYAPTSAAPDAEFFSFLSCLAKAWKVARSNGMAILTGTDLNTRLGGERDDLHIGPMTLGTASAETRCRAQTVLEEMSQVKLSAWSTMLGSPHYTWTSPHDTPAQIDYLIGDISKLARILAITIEDLESFASDHSMVIAQLTPNIAEPRRVNSLRPSVAKIRSQDHSLAVKLALSSCDHSSWLSLTNPVQAMERCIELVKVKVKEAPGSTAVKQREWIEGNTWDKIRLGARMRRVMNRLWKCFNNRRQIWAWTRLAANSGFARIEQGVDREPGQTFALNSWAKCELAYFAWTLARVASRTNARQVQKMARRDKFAWLSSKTDELGQLCLEGTTSEIHQQVKKCLIKMSPNALATKRAPLKDEEGKVYVTDDAKQLLWQQHWTKLYGGNVKSATDSFCSSNWPDLGEDELEQRTLAVGEADLFTPAEIRSALRHQMNGKASVDGVPSRELVAILPHMVPVWTKACNQFLATGSLPKTFKGATLFVVPKKASTTTTSDFRGLQLMLWSSKVLARALYLKCMSRIQVAIAQYGIGVNSGCDYPHLLVTQLHALARTQERRLACWYIDVRTAFDKIIRQLLIAPGNSLTLSTLKALGIPEDRAKAILREVMDDQPILWEHGLSRPIVKLLEAYLTETWIAIPEDQGSVQLSTGLGTPQGSSLSGLLFVLYQQRIHSLITQYIHDREYGLVLDAPTDNSYSMTNTERVHVPVIAYHDDALVVLTAHTVQRLVEVVKEVAQQAITTYEGRNLLLNWSSMKSELMFLLPSTESIAFHATVAAESQRRGWDHPCISFADVRLRVVRTYNYLGLRVQDTGSTTMHAKTRTAMAAGSMRQFGQIYSSKQVSLRHKANLCNGMYTIATMMHGHAALKELEVQSTKTYATMYLHTWKACIGKEVVANGQFAHLTEDAILDRVSKPSWTVWADVSRLRLLLRVVKCMCPVVRALLASSGIEQHSWWLAIARSIERLRNSVAELAGFPPFTEHTRGVWLQMVALDKESWRKYLKKYMNNDVQQRHDRQLALDIQEDAQPVPEILHEMFTCTTCQKQCSTYRGLLSHRRQAHNQESALAVRVGSNICYACHGEYPSRVAHLAHLTSNLRCALATMIHCPRLSEAELTAAKAVKVFIRTAPPKRGPKMKMVDEVFPQSRPIQYLDIDIG
eukprot:6485558-Amphidinium_carterae.3